jgi:hypothetical protein
MASQVNPISSAATTIPLSGRGRNLVQEESIRPRRELVTMPAWRRKVLDYSRRAMGAHPFHSIFIGGFSVVARSSALRSQKQCVFDLDLEKSCAHPDPTGNHSSSQTFFGHR